MSPGGSRRTYSEPSAEIVAAVRKLMDDVAAGRATVDEGVTRWRQEIAVVPGKQVHPAVGVFLGLFFVLGGGLFAVIGLLMGWQSLQYSLAAEEAAGVVVELKETHSRRGGTSWHPVVRYVVDGKEFTVTGAGGSGWFRFSVGDTVDVLYLPAHPQEAQLNTFAQRWLMPLVAGTMGSLFACIGGALAWASWDDWRQRKSLAIAALVALPMLVLFAAPLAADEKLKDIACRSVHWGYETPPSLVFYNEVKVERSAPGTYFCVCGFNQGYYGLQELADGKRLLIFSVWDPTAGDDPDKVKPEDRVQLLHRDAAVRVGRFGGEGTGGQSFFDYAWKNDVKYRLLVAAHLDGKRTAYSAYFFMPEDNLWRRLATFAARTGGKPLGGGYSFVEDFRRNRESTKQARAAEFGNGRFRTVDGVWQPLNTGRFTADSNPVLNINAAVHRGRFWLATGGDVTNDDLPLRTRVELPELAPPPGPDDLPSLWETITTDFRSAEEKTKP
jgi:hypothetical protein